MNILKKLVELQPLINTVNNFMNIHDYIINMNYDELYINLYQVNYIYINLY